MEGLEVGQGGLTGLEGKGEISFTPGIFTGGSGGRWCTVVGKMRIYGGDREVWDLGGVWLLE
jgi:hypothetical protein